MTDLTNIGPTTKTSPSEAPTTADEDPTEADMALQHRLAVGRQRRRHPAMGARIFAAGLSTAAMFGIVAVMGAEASSEPVVSAVEQTATPAMSVGNPQDRSPALVSADLPIEVPTKVTVTEFSNEPIQLTAEPVIRAAEQAPAKKAAPIAKTNGSR